MWVYLIQMTLPIGIDPIKIGVAYNPYRRAAGLNTHGPYPVQLLGFCEGGKDQEDQLHKEYAHARLHGEWFQLTITELALLQKRFITPPALPTPPPKKKVGRRADKIRVDKRKRLPGIAAIGRPRSLFELR